MKTLIIGELLLAPLFLLCSSLYWLGVIYLAALVITAWRDKKIARFWVRVYKENLRLENQLLNLNLWKLKSFVLKNGAKRG